MHTYQAQTVVEQDGRLVLSGLPFPKGEKVEVVIREVSKENGDDDAGWKRLAIESFFRDSREKDADYDILALREARQENANARGISMDEMKQRLGLTA